MSNIKTIIKSILYIDPEEIENKTLINVFAENNVNIHIVKENVDVIHLIEKNKYNCVLINNNLKYNLCYKYLDLIKCNFPWVITIIVINLDNESLISFTDDTTEKIAEDDSLNLKENKSTSLTHKFSETALTHLLENIFTYVRTGADDFLIKPFKWDDIEKLLKFYYY